MIHITIKGTIKDSKMTSQAHIAPFYRLFHLYIEPFLAFYGAVMAARSPLLYLSVMSPAANLSHFNPEVRVIFDQLAAVYFLFAFNEAIVLRVADGNLRVWNAMVSGMVFCDLFTIRATVNAMGWDALLDPLGWRLYDWVNIVTLLGALSTRTAFLSGWGVTEGAAPVKETTGVQTRSKTKTG